MLLHGPCIWLEWATDRISFAEMAVQHDLIHILEEGLKVYSKTLTSISIGRSSQCQKAVAPQQLQNSLYTPGELLCCCMGTCVCNSCRLSSGFPIQTWAFVPKSNIFNADGSPLVFKHQLPEANPHSHQLALVVHRNAKRQ
jgi:hypothetical protein